MASLDVQRSALIERVKGARPSILGLFAPAGFGKSSFARQLLAEEPGRLCDCAGARDELELARRLLPELTSRFEDGALSRAERIELATGAWSALRGVLVFENADRIGAAAEAMLTRLLSDRPVHAVTVVCARDGGRFHVNRLASPHETLVFRASDLAFDASDVHSLRGLGQERQCERMIELSRGWPIAVSVLNRIVNEGRAGAEFEHLKRAAYGELRDYIDDDVLGAMPARMLGVLFACAAIPRAKAADLQAAFGDAELISDLKRLAKDWPFLARDAEGNFEVHPLIAMVLTEHQEDRRASLLADIALLREETGEFERAAELHLARGDQHAAARALGRHEVLADRRPGETYRHVLRSIDRAVIARYPRLWAMTALSRLFRVETDRLADEAESILRTLPPDMSVMERFYVVMVRVVLASYADSYADALDMVDACSSDAAVSDPPRSLLEGYLTLLRAMLQAGAGGYAAAEDGFTRALAIVGDVDVSAASALLCFGADIARGRGERALEVQFLERALERARTSQLPNIVASVMAEALCGAWFAGDRAAHVAAADALENWINGTGIVGFTYLLHCARGRRAEPSAFDVQRSVIYGRLMSLGYSREIGDRIRLAEAALSSAARLGQPFLEVLSAIALGECDELRFADCQSLAWDAASRCDSTALAHAVDAVAERRSHLAMLGPFVANIARGRRDAPPPIAIDVLGGRARVDGEVIMLSGRELELLIALALRRESTSRARIASLLWPDLDEAAARNAFSVCLHRLRAHLRRNDLIARDGDGYRLHDDATVDVWEIERVSKLLRSRETLRESERVALERAWMRLREEQPSRMEEWEWLEPTRRNLRGLRIEAAHRLAAQALEGSDAQGALQFAQDAISLDSCDEQAHEAVIRAHLLTGDRAAAVRAFRRYSETLRDELGAKPSNSIAALVSA